MEYSHWVNISEAGVDFTINWSPFVGPTLTLVTAAICFFGLVGNFAVLYGSLTDNALQLEPVSKTLIEIIAACDMIGVVLVYFTILVTLIAGKWILGPVVCYISAQSGFLVVLNGTWLVLVLSVYRSWRIRQPRTRKPSMKLLMSAVLGTLTITSMSLLIYSTLHATAVYTPQALTCITDVFLVNRSGRYISVIFNVIPLLFIVVLNKQIQIAVFMANRRSNNSIKNVRKPLVMLTVVVYMEVLSLLPFNSLILMSVSGNPAILSKMESIRSWFMLFCQYSVSLNICSNPIIFYISSVSFRAFVKRQISTMGPLSSVAPVPQE